VDSHHSHLLELAQSFFLSFLEQKDFSQRGGHEIRVGAGVVGQVVGAMVQLE